MLSKIQSGATMGLEAVPIDIEVDVASRGLPALSIVGLGDKAVQESKERVRAALQNSGIQFPAKRITINLAPADIPKQGPAFDLPIAIGVLGANGDVDLNLKDAFFWGELSLDGSLRSTQGALSIAILVNKLKGKKLFLPAANASEASMVKNITVYPVDNLIDLIAHLIGLTPIKSHPPTNVRTLLKQSASSIDMADIKGQEQAKRAMEIAAAGHHNIFLSGTPGAGKTMLSRAFAGILPKLTPREALEITNIFSIGGLLKPGQALITERPFRSPHHTTSRVGLIGGGSNPRPGEISLSHRGVLFLDEFPEFPRSITESLRQPMEDGTVHITRAQFSTSYPCRFILVAAANPCPCGNLGSPTKTCICSNAQINRYQKRISGPMLDRIDLHVEVKPVDLKKLAQFQTNDEPSYLIQARVQKAREIQQTRFQKSNNLHANGEMSTKAVKQYCQLTQEQIDFLTTASEKMGLSARGYFKVIKVARTIADLEGSDEIKINHLAESLQYRPNLDHYLSLS